jgi:hypothetical protein
MKPHEIAALMERDKSGKPFWQRRFEQEKAASEVSYSASFESRFPGVSDLGDAAEPEAEPATPEGGDADYRLDFQRRHGFEATA